MNKLALIVLCLLALSLLALYRMTHRPYCVLRQAERVAERAWRRENAWRWE